jgi:DNA-binding response OmpR family regulator
MEKSALVVDDDVTLLSLVALWLSTAGYQVKTLSDFNQAKALLRAERVGLLITDVRLGEFNGLQLAIEARSGGDDIAIVVMSGWVDNVVTQEVSACNGVVLRKPFTEDALLAAVRSTGR